MSSVVNVVRNVVNTVVNVISTVIKAVVNIVAAVVNMVASPFMGLMGMPNIPNMSQETTRNDGVVFQRNGGGAQQIPVIYGYRKVGGVVTFAETGSTTNRYLWVAYTFCEGLVEGLNEIWIDDNQLSVDVVRGLNSGQIVNVPDAKYSGRVKMQWFPGVYFNDPASSPVGTRSILSEAPSWKSTHVHNGLAVLMVRFEWLAVTTQAQADANPFSGQIPQVQVTILGKRVASLRTGAGTENYTYGGTGYTERYSTNPAECLLDYLRNPRYGKGLNNTDIDWDSFYIAAQKCNQQIRYTNAVAGPILTTNAVVSTDQTLFANVKMLLMNFRAYLPYVQGKYKLKIEDAGNPYDIMSGSATIAGVFNRDSIVGDVTYTGIDKSVKYNQVVVTYVDPDQKFSTQSVTYPENEVERQVYINFDGGRENKLEVTLGCITNQQIARDMARLMFNKSRFQESCSLTVTGAGFNLEPGDNIFIQSNILNFGYIPWRVVSIKLNNNYTFDLGCVRNPDYIYPYVIPNTPDVIIAPYIPKGASILPPLTGGQTLVGLVPPVTAPLLPGIVSTATTNPPTTVTTGTNGGGVGGSTGTVNTGGGTPPVVPPVTNVLTDYVTIDQAIVSFPSTGLANVDITYRQPDNAMFSGIQLYYKLSSSAETIWTLVNIDTRPGAGQNITYRLANLLATNASTAYDIKTRVKYSTGEFSTVIDKTQIITGVAGITNPVDYQESITSGWSLITSGPSARNDYLGYILGAPILTAGLPSTPRTMDITIQQDATAHAINPDITGIKIFYKSSAASYWAETLIPFTSYVAGTRTTVRLADLGVPTSAQNYDFIFRFAYRDGSLSTFQIRYMTVPVESSLGLYDYNPFYVLQQRVEATTAYSFMTVAQGVASGAISDVRDMKIGVAGVNVALSGTSAATFYLVPPDSSVAQSWIGVKIYYRPVQPGANPVYQTATYSSPPAGSFGAISTRNATLNITYDQAYQYLIVPLVYYGGAVIEGNYSWFGQASVHNVQTRLDYPSTGNWAPAFNWRQDATSLLKGTIATGFAQTDPTAVVSVWNINNDNAGGGGAVVGTTIPYYYQLTFSVAHVTSLNEVYIYKRHNAGLKSGYSPYWGIGRWDKITLNTSSPNYSAGVFTLNLSLPVSYQEFNSSSLATTSTLYTSFPVPPIKRVDVPGLRYEEYYIVVKAAGTVSAKAIKLPNGWLNASTPSYNLLNALGPPTTVDWPTVAQDSSYATGWMRTTGEARTAAANSSTLVAPNISFNGTSGVSYKSGTI